MFHERGEVTKLEDPVRAWNLSTSMLCIVAHWKHAETKIRDIVTKAIDQVTASTIRRSGGVLFYLLPKVSKLTITNIRATIANHHGVSLANSVMMKTDHRIVAECSH